MKKNEYRVLSPDGIDIEYNKVYTSQKAVLKALKDFRDRYKAQGYYSTIVEGTRVQLPLGSIIECCEIIIN